MTNHPNRSRSRRTVNGVPVIHTRVFQGTYRALGASGKVWRWKIIDANGREFLDGGNYLTRAQAESGLANALDPVRD